MSRARKKETRLTVRELADYLDIPLSAAYRGLQSGYIPSRRIGAARTRYIIFRSVIDRWRRCEKQTSVIEAAPTGGGQAA